MIAQLAVMFDNFRSEVNKRCPFYELLFKIEMNEAMARVVDAELNKSAMYNKEKSEEGYFLCGVKANVLPNLLCHADETDWPIIRFSCSFDSVLLCVNKSGEIVPVKTGKELKPCPFCGKSDDVFFEPTHDLKEVLYRKAPSVGCKRCRYRIDGEIFIVPGDDEHTFKYSDHLLLNWWNERNGQK